MKRVTRPSNYTDRMFGGVCTGLSEYFHINLAFLRTIWFISCSIGIGIVLYILLWVILPSENYKTIKN